MKQERFSEEKIVGILREAEKGEKPVADLCREHGIAEQTFYRWRRKYGGLDTRDVQRLKELTAENARLKRLLAERDLEVDVVRERAHIPVLRIDEAMIAEAVASGPRITVIATNETTLEPARQSLQAEADRLRRGIEVKLVPVDGALPALLSGDAARHDRLVAAAVQVAATQCDVLVLAQASMERVLAAIPENARPVPILSSPHLALAQVRRTLGLQH